jgi:hypothetical protein
MSVAPPVLPEKALHRVRAIARADGWSIVIIAALGGLVSLLQGGWIATAAALLVVLAGTGELHGRRLLLRRKSSGCVWLIAAQLFLLAVIWAYAWWRWRYFDPATLWAELPGFAQAKLDRDLLAAGLDPEFDRPLLLDLMNTLTCAILALVSLVYQGGLACYYAAQRHRVRQALADLPAPPL